MSEASGAGPGEREHSRVAGVRCQLRREVGRRLGEQGTYVEDWRAGHEATCRLVAVVKVLQAEGGQPQNQEANPASLDAP